MPTSFSSHHNASHGENHDPHLSSGFADHLEVESAVSVSMIEEALNVGALALGAEPSHVVDLGAGTGAGTLALAARFPRAHVDSLDISADLLAKLDKAAASAGVADRVTSHLVDLDDDWSGLLTAHVDLIWASMSLHHVQDAEQVLRQALAALRPGGVLVVSEMTGVLTYEPEDLNSGVAGLGGRVMTALNAAGYPATAHWSRELADAGFTSVRRHEHTVTVAGNTIDGARYLRGQFQAWAPRLAYELTPAERAGLDSAITELGAGTSPIVHTSGRAIWVAVRPADATRSAEGASHPIEVNAGASAQAKEPRAIIEAEVVIIGGGAAGLAASVALARSRRSVVVVDAGQPRNAVAHGAHNVLGNEGISPLALLARGRSEAQSYGVHILHGHATTASGTIDNFTVEVDGGTCVVQARRVILASGLIDDLPDVPGVEEAWGESVLHCPFCHGWEIRDQRIGILTRDEVAVHHAMLFRQLSDDVTLFLHGAAEPTDEQWDQLAALDVRVVTPRVDKLILDGRQVKAVQIDGGHQFDIDAVIIAPKYNVRTELFEALGGEATSTPFGRQIQASPQGATTIPGVFTAGNAGEPMAMLVASTASGVTTGSAVHGSLVFADLAAAVERRRAPFSAMLEAENTTRILGDHRHGV